MQCETETERENLVELIWADLMLDYIGFLDLAEY